jgi:hypothetical protein
MIKSGRQKTKLINMHKASPALNGVDLMAGWPRSIQTLLYRHRSEGRFTAFSVEYKKLDATINAGQILGACLVTWKSSRRGLFLLSEFLKSGK